MICSTIDIFRKYLPTAIHSDFAKYESEINDANAWIAREILGAELYNIITEGLPESMYQLLPLCEAVVARRAYLTGIPSFDLAETASGFVVARNENQAPASPERVAKLLASIETKLSDAIEDLLEFLEVKAPEFDEAVDISAAWLDSPTYTMLTDTFIPTVRMFRRYAPFPGSRLEWIAKHPAMMNVIQLQMWPILSQELCDEIITELRESYLSAASEEIIQNIRYAYALLVAGETDPGMSYLYRVRKYIIANIDSYSTFENSAMYTNYLATVVEKNTIEKPIFRAGF
jgi:hypothetical protein